MVLLPKSVASLLDTKPNDLRDKKLAQFNNDLVDRITPRAHPSHRSIEFVPDRPGHDRRYAVDTAKLERELGWTPSETLETGLEKTLRWYLENRNWWQEILARRYQGERLGLGR